MDEELKTISANKQKSVVSAKGLKPVSTSIGGSCKKIGSGLNILK